MKQNIESNYNTLAIKSFGENFLRSLLDEPCVKESDLLDIIRDSAERTYFTTFTDDSDYLYDSIGLMALKEIWDNEPDKRNAIVSCLDHFYSSGNWIVKMHVNDLAKEIGLEKNYKRF